MKKVCLILGLVWVLVLSAGLTCFSADTMSGWISDDHCGAKGAKAGHEGCAKGCVGKGGKAVFVSDKDGSILVVSNQDAVKDHLGHHVTVTGTVDADAKSINVDRVSMGEA